MSLETERPRDNTRDKMQMDIYMASGQHYNTIIELHEVHEIKELWSAAVTGKAKFHFIELVDQLENQAVQLRLIYISSVTHKPAAADAVGRKIEYN